jgi:hypothetical protein
MDQAQWLALSVVLRKVTRRLRPLKRVRFSDYLIARLYFWAVLHDRPMTWTADRTHYNRLFRPRKLPSVSQLNRRIASDRFQQLLQRTHEEQVAGGAIANSAASAATSTTYLIDGKPLNVSPVSRDRDARAGQLGRGYKLHAIVAAASRQIPVFCVLALNHHEMPVARVMLQRLGTLRPGTLIMADGNYDAHVLHKDVATRGGWLITRPRGCATHPVTRRKMGPARRELIDLWTHHPKLMRRVYRRRTVIERVFGHLTCTPGLLGPLPAFVRGLARVRRWVGSKICLYHARCHAKAGMNGAG